MDKFFIKFLYRASIVVYRKGEVISLWSAVVVILNVFVEFFWNNKEKENERVQSKNLILKKNPSFLKESWHSLFSVEIKGFPLPTRDMSVAFGKWLSSSSKASNPRGFIKNMSNRGRLSTNDMLTPSKPSPRYSCWNCTKYQRFNLASIAYIKYW